MLLQPGDNQVYINHRTEQELQDAGLPLESFDFFSQCFIFLVASANQMFLWPF
jgi:hypothetical protein